MTPKIVLQVGMVFLVSAIAVLLFSAYRSSTGTPSTGLSILGTVLLVMAIGMRMRARRAAS
ncbi:MAG: hypothetical protein H7268_03295 [Sandarakinorhabdus sp.]|nr:hypothetical protein [Sandarakinorhabdus sp.]